VRAVVTGAASGIGRATARRFVDEGYEVLGVDLDPERLVDLAVDGAETMVADVGDPEQRAAIAVASAGCDALVNAAGILVASDLLDVTVDDWRRLFTVNAESVFFLCQQIGRTMPSGSAIVNLSSSSAKYATTTEVAVYAATKTTILSITRSFAYRLAGQGVRVNAICPGVIDTPMQDKVLAEIAPRRGLTVEQMSAARNAAVPLGRPGTPAETAALIWFLCSPESSYMTGQAVNLTGGMVTW
jgi:NAD(P)-dependent dehydrogenase (short-subunit alcohol dehydrogenase family)